MRVDLLLTDAGSLRIAINAQLQDPEHCADSIVQTLRKAIEQIELTPPPEPPPDHLEWSERGTPRRRQPTPTPAPRPPRRKLPPKKG